MRPTNSIDTAKNIDIFLCAMRQTVAVHAYSYRLDKVGTSLEAAFLPSSTLLQVIA
jgi:hypothetical protein